MFKKQTKEISVLKIVSGAFSDNLSVRSSFCAVASRSKFGVIAFVKSQRPTKSEAGCLGRGTFRQPPSAGEGWDLSRG